MRGGEVCRDARPLWNLLDVTPAKAGAHAGDSVSATSWAPAFAGVTSKEVFSISPD
jgi:hypothetical protein